MRHKEQLLKDYKRINEIIDYFEFRLQSYEDPDEFKAGAPRYPYTNLAFENAIPTGLEKLTMERKYFGRELWDTEETFQEKLKKRKAQKTKERQQL